MDQGRRDQGCVAKLIRDAFAISDFKVRFVFMPWERAYQEGLKTEFSGSAYWYLSKQRANDYIYTKTPITTEISRFYHLTSLQFTYQTYKDLAPYRLVLNQGLTYPKELLEAVKKYDISIVNATYTTKNLPFLLRDRADIVILTEQTKTAYAKALTPEQNKLITFQAKPAFIKQGYLLINKHSEQYVSIFDEGVAALWKNKAYYDDYAKHCLRIKGQ
ncbi:transporter substrate-binding domain-containing protein [Pseudoalteromonas sp. JBTF-M23]|uniref:Transporter substrate-binding domain-containing protein n=1 Tax=Pseudoalteromonas caenipelagi TaxID=2726988 RepID=A0A849VGM4_9GAMM|nr:transporter substrate-binding domain-containing protein [Pseudoalteromonas caenipelagi]NOU52879.1 transporter substrate-binding domain-containing protein [Pseudoalteromonas caenipelagi]